MPQSQISSATPYGPSTIGLRKISGQWRITHERNSTPFYMDGSGKAALDPQP